MMRMKSYACLFAAALLLATASIAAAQEFRATVRGQVLDSSKGALPGATVSMTNTETNEVATATTNTEGNYTHPLPSSRLLYADGRAVRDFRSTRAAGMTLAGQRDRDDQRRARRRRCDRGGDGFR